MNVILSKVAFLSLVLSLAGVPGAMAQSQQDNSDAKTANYRPGQVWATVQGVTITILALEDVRKVGRVVHVRVDKIPVQSCGDIHLTRAIDHLAITENVLRKSGLALSMDNVDLPESSIDAYRKWEEKKKHEVIKVPIQKAILTEGNLPGPMICNFVPSQT
jgi:hypothetical protein